MTALLAPAVVSAALLVERLAFRGHLQTTLVTDEYDQPPA